MKLINFIFATTSLTGFLAWQNNSIVVSKHYYVNNKLPKNFEGFKILQISDFHNKKFHGRLIRKMKEINPDIIVITGDLIDRRKPNLKLTEEFIKETVKIASTYFVSGNHEQLSKHYTELKEILSAHKVINMDDSYTTIKNGDSVIGLIGVAAPVIIKSENRSGFEDNDAYVKYKLKDLTKNFKTDFNILIAHRPEQINVYKEFDFDLVFSGHAHGGQIRIPFVGGILAPNQGFFPKYSEGIHKEGKTSMVVSRGLGNSTFPFRIFNRPELIVGILGTDQNLSS